MGRIVGWIIGILILYAIITQPTQAAATTGNLGSALASAGQQVVVFVESIVGSTTTYSQVHAVPAGSVETGDGSYP
ncbi:hypothetical protein [Actinomycetospora sp.]|uniref:hypothetical protein n=1 Tax=Actinomycetospora sp. TaxID=1872135 RepID=UPI002F426AEA